MSYITVNGKPLQVFNVQMDGKPLVEPDPDACKRFNHAMRKATENIVVQFAIPPQTPDVQYDGEIIPTGLVVDWSIEHD